MNSLLLALLLLILFAFQAFLLFEELFLLMLCDFVRHLVHILYFLDLDQLLRRNILSFGLPLEVSEDFLNRMLLGFEDRIDLRPRQPIKV